MDLILAALLRFDSPSSHLNPVSLHSRPVYLSFCLCRYCTMDFIHCEESLSSLCLHVFFFSWCVAHVRNTILVLLSFCMTWFPLWKFKILWSRSVLMVSTPAVLCLKCHNVVPGVQLLGSAPNQRLVHDYPSSQALVAPIRAVLCILITACAMEMWFYFPNYKLVFLYCPLRPCLH